MQEIHIFVTGKVQGVGFRASVLRHAHLHDIKGFVRNLPDGRVEICAQGKGDQINAFIHTVKLRPGLGQVDEIETKLHPVRESYPSFEIH